MDLDDAESRWRDASSDHERARAVGLLVRAGFVAARAVTSGARPSGVSRAVANMAAAAVDASVRAWLCDRALEEALAESRTTWTLDVMVALAKMHPPAVAPALAMARTARDEATPEAVVWTQERSAALASLSCLVEPAARRAVVDEALSIARATRVHDRNDRIVVNAAPGLVAHAPEALFALVESVTLGDPAWTWARIARSSTGALRFRALRRALQNPVGSARPLVEAADLLPVELLPRALEMASAMYPSVNFGATALRAVLPAWAAAGNVRDALVRARAIPEPGERGTTLARLVAHVAEREREALLREAMASMSLCQPQFAHQPSDCLSRAIDDLAPLGVLSQLERSDVALGGEALAKLAARSDGETRARLLQRLAETGEVEALAPVARELPAEAVFPRWMRALRTFSARGEEFLEDDCGWGFVQWCPLTATIGGDEGLRGAAAALR